jgi:hypothetical protein
LVLKLQELKWAKSTTYSSKVLTRKAYQYFTAAGTVQCLLSGVNPGSGLETTEGL